MNSHDEYRLDPDVETAELRRQMETTGITDYLEDDLDHVELESAESLIARLKTAEEDVSSHPQPSSSRRRLVPTLLAGTAAAVIAGIVFVIQPWSTPVARAGTPPILDFEFAEARRIADSPGVDPAATLEGLARAAEQNETAQPASAVQHVVTEGWAIDTDFDPDPNSTITPTRSENWLYPDGRLRSRSHLGDPLDADGRGIPIGGRLDRETEFFDEHYEPAGSKDPRLFTDIPDNVQGVRDALLDNIRCLERKRGQERSLCLTEQLRNLTGMYVIPPAIMSNIWRMLAEEEGIRSLGNVKDRTGRDAVALSFIWEGAPEYRLVILADRSTGQFVGSERILIRPSESSPVDPPAILEFSTITKSTN